MKKITQIMVIWVLSVGISVPVLGLEIRVAARGVNELDFQPAIKEGETRFNQQDCLENYSFKLVFTGISDSTQDGSPYLLIGDDCINEPEDCTSIELENSARDGDYTIKQLFEDEYGGSCDGEGNADIWLVKSTDIDDVDGLTERSDPVKFDWDMDPPAPPTMTKTTPGSKKVTVEWAVDSSNDADAGDDDEADETAGEALESEVDAVLILYAKGDVTGSVSTTDDDEGDTSDDADDTAVDQGVDTELVDAGQMGGDDAGVGVVADVRNLDRFDFMDGYTPRQDTESDESEEEDAVTTCATDVIAKGAAYEKTSDYSNTPIEQAKGGSGTVTGLDNGDAYLFGLVAKDEYGNPSEISNTMCETPGETTGFTDHFEDAGGKGGKFCFVATAAFGSYDHPVVKILRSFRDEFLEPLPGGRKLIATYYELGPAAAAVIEDAPLLKGAAQSLLVAFAMGTIPLTKLGPLGSLIFGIFALLGVAVFSYRRSR